LPWGGHYITATEAALRNIGLLGVTRLFYISVEALQPTGKEKPSLGGIQKTAPPTFINLCLSYFF
jgi:hypothetical protein